MKKQLEIQPPAMPDYFTYKNPDPLPKGVGMVKHPEIDIRLLSKDEAVKFADMMKMEFIKHWKQRTEVS